MVSFSLRTRFGEGALDGFAHLTFDRFNFWNCSFRGCGSAEFGSAPDRTCCRQSENDRCGATMRTMQLDLTDEELATAATACREMAYQERRTPEKDRESRHAWHH